MVYALKSDLVLETDAYKTTTFNKNTVALSYIVDYKLPATKETKLSIVAVDKQTGNILCGLNTRTFTGDAYAVVNSLFDVNGNLTSEGYEYSLDNFTINGVSLRQIVDGPVELPTPPVEEEIIEE